MPLVVAVVVLEADLMLNCTRLPNWRDKLTDEISRVSEDCFLWGTNDCFQFIANCIESYTGHDITNGSRGSYTTPLGGIKQLLKLGGCHQLKEYLDTLFPLDHIAFAKPGDVVFKNSNQDGYDAILGICYGQISFFILEEGGLTKFQTLQLDGCWKVI